MHSRIQKTRIGAYGVIRRDNMMLLCRLSKMVPGWEGYWTLPGGGIEFGEHPEEAVIREVREETGYEVAVGRLLGVDSIVRENEKDAFQSIRIIYEIDIIGGEQRDEVNGTTDCCDWITITDRHQFKMVDFIEKALEMADH